MKTSIETKGSQLEELNRFLGLLQGQDDRALVLSLAAFIEDSLGRLLLAYFRDCKQTRELVEGFSAPLGTLGTRTKAVYAFGLVSEDQYRDMEILRRIRNAFAHDWRGISFERNDIKAMIGQLSGYTFNQQPIQEAPREKLHETAATICIELNIFTGRLLRGEAEKAADHSFRLTTVLPTEPPRRRYVK